MLRRVLSYNTRIGPFYIVQEGRQFHAAWKYEFLGAYSTPQQAIDDLVGGHTFSLSNGVETDTLGIPDEAAEWSRV